MIELEDSKFMCQTAADLPALPGSVGRLYVDFETGSGDPRADSLNPWHTCFIAGYSVTYDDMREAYYVPVAHVWGGNVPRDAAVRWLQDAMRRADAWVNHNVKYDAHVYLNDFGGPLPPSLVDTVVASKIIDSDRIYRGGYGLDALSVSWLREDIRHYERALQPHLVKNKDYSRVPADVMAPYACQDVQSVRRLDKFTSDTMPEDCADVWRTEQRLTSILLDMEQVGVRVDPRKLQVEQMKLLHEILQIELWLKEKLGREVRPHVNDDCHEVLCGQFGLPVVALTDNRNPSFDKAAMAKYAIMPGAPHDVIKQMIRCRQLTTNLTYFVEPYLRYNIDGVLHPNHNQLVRTGRMSCSQPNTQQLNKFAKSLVLPREGTKLLSTDAAQIEFRTIVHYIQDAEALAAFRADPRVDFHQWVADASGIKRRPAKTVNFATAFGQGRRACVAALSVNPDIVADITAQCEGIADPEERQSQFRTMVRERCENIHDGYHERFPGIKRTSRNAERVSRARGYVRTVRGRHRHIPIDLAHIAFNTINQGSAADIVKDGMVRLYDELPALGLRMLLQVHDEIVIEGQPDAVDSPAAWAKIMDVLELPDCDLTVPIRWDLGTSDVDWKTACSDEAKVDVERACVDAGVRRDLLPRRGSPGPSEKWATSCSIPQHRGV